MSDLKPLHAINVYIEPWFREEILTLTLEDFSGYTAEIRKELTSTVKNEVKVSGFRNPLTAPKRLLVREADKLFEKDPRFVGIVLKSWMSHFQKNDKFFQEALQNLGFTFAEEAKDFADALNAFHLGWPKNVDYQKVIEEVRKNELDPQMSDDQIMLYGILKTGYLPGESEE